MPDKVFHSGLCRHGHLIQLSCRHEPRKLRNAVIRPVWRDHPRGEQSHRLPIRDARSSGSVHSTNPCSHQPSKGESGRVQSLGFSPTVLEHAAVVLLSSDVAQKSENRTDDARDRTEAHCDESRHATFTVLAPRSCNCHTIGSTPLVSESTLTDMLYLRRVSLRHHFPVHVAPGLFAMVLRLLQQASVPSSTLSAYSLRNWE